MIGVFEPTVVISSSRMSRVLAWCRVVALLACAVLLVAGTSHARDRVAQLSKQLRESSDFRVRTQAALALGASGSREAVRPLCGGLNDTNASVRAASAAALGKLRKGGSECLKQRLAEESSGAVKSVINKALSRLARAAVKAPQITEATKYYVAVEVLDKTERTDGKVAGLVRDGMANAADKLEECVLAPAGQSQTEAQKMMAKHPQLRGFLLAAQVGKPQYAGGTVSVRIAAAIFTYPGRALKGTIPVKLTQQGGKSSDRSSENELIMMAATRAMQKFVQNAGRIP